LDARGEGDADLHGDDPGRGERVAAFEPAHGALAHLRDAGDLLLRQPEQLAQIAHTRAEILQPPAPGLAMVVQFACVYVGIPQGVKRTCAAGDSAFFR
jgi:hypothetical protein